MLFRSIIVAVLFGVVVKGGGQLSTGGPLAVSASVAPGEAAPPAVKELCVQEKLAAARGIASNLMIRDRKAVGLPHGTRQAAVMKRATKL